MKKLVITICLLAGMLLLQGCCTIVSGTTQKVPIASVPPGVTVTTGDGQSIVTPGVLILRRKDVQTLTAELDGYQPQTRTLTRKWNGWLWADVLWDFGLITGTIDFATGAAYKQVPGDVTFRMLQPGATTRWQPSNFKFSYVDKN